MENIMGRCKRARGGHAWNGFACRLPGVVRAAYCPDDNPVRKLYNKAWADFATDIPICWMQTVCAKDEATNVRLH
jgi:hypothetical protein